MKTIILIFLSSVLSLFTLDAQSLEWVKQIGGKGGKIESQVMTMDSSSNIYIAGRFFGTIDMDPSPSKTLNFTPGQRRVGIFISKFDSTGQLLWAKELKDKNDDSRIRIRDILLDKMGNILLTGHFEGEIDFDPGPGSFNLKSSKNNNRFTQDIFVLKISASGNFLWAKKMGGSSSWVQGHSIVTDANDDVYINGSFSGSANFNPGSGSFTLSSNGFRDIFVCKLNSVGNFMWAKQIGGKKRDISGSLKIDNSGNINFLAFFRDTVVLNPGPGTFNVTIKGNAIVKLDSSGGFIWAKKIGAGSYMALDESGQFYVTGTFTATTDFDPGSGTFNLVPDGSSDIFISKLSSKGDLIWAKSVRGSADYGDYPNHITLAPDGHAYISGRFKDTADFDPGSGMALRYALKKRGSTFILKLDTSGNFRWVKQVTNAHKRNPDPNRPNLRDSVAKFMVNYLGNIYSVGYFGDTTDFAPGSSVFNLSPLGKRDVFIHKMSNNTVSIPENNPVNSFQVFPNPSEGLVTINLGSTHSHIELTVSDITGRKIMQKTFQGARQLKMTLPETAGMYFILVNADQHSELLKVIKK